MNVKRCALVFSMVAGLSAVSAIAAGLDEFKVKREMVFEFAERPAVKAEGDRIEIRFTTKAFCDATVVIEDAAGPSGDSGQAKIVRHLASGVLGPNAPTPFQKDSKSQLVTWDGKDDQGRYVVDKSTCVARVSLGLEASFERSLYWEPKKRLHAEAPGLAAAPEGVYVYDGRVFDHVTLYDHDGNYVRTVYPFPADKIEQIKDLHWATAAQDDGKVARKEGFHQSTLLSCGINAGFDEKVGHGIDVHNNWDGAVHGNAGSVLAVRDKRMALARLLLNRLATDGGDGGLGLNGPAAAFPSPSKGRNDMDESGLVPPRSAAFSPDGKWLYLTCYPCAHGTHASRDIVLVEFYDWLPLVARIDFQAGGKPEVFLGGPGLASAGSDDTHFKTPTSVAVDAAGRIYISDFVNDRVQVYSPEGKLLKTIDTEGPAQVAIHQKTQQIYVFSWDIPHIYGEKKDKPNPKLHLVRKNKGPAMPAVLTVFKSFEDPTEVMNCPLPVGGMVGRGSGQSYRYELDSWAEPTTIWLAREWGRLDIMTRDRYPNSNVLVYTLKKGQLELKRDFNADTAKSVVVTAATEYGRQRLYVNPADGCVYVGDSPGSGKCFRDMARLDPRTGAVQVVHLPFDAEDMAFDLNGLAYLRTFYVVARFDPKTWREVPFDYGEEHKGVSTNTSSDRRTADVQSAIRLPVKEAGLHHHGGMSVSPAGNLIVAVNNYGTEKISRKDLYDPPAEVPGAPYVPRIFPGRVRWGEIHVFDAHGKMLYEDAVPGLNRTDGVALDRDDNIYALSTAVRMYEGKMYYNYMGGTLLKVPAKKAKVLSASDRAAVPLPAGEQPKRPADVGSGHLDRAWIEGAQWFYGGLGFAGKNAPGTGGCDCYNARFALDYLGRSFVPEIDHYSVGVLDSNGNLIMRVGRYGNADDGKPLVAGGAGPSARSIGGDEVALFDPRYLATDTDHRLFIADAGNGRVVSVKLSYKQSEKVPLK